MPVFSINLLFYYNAQTKKSSKNVVSNGQFEVIVLQND